MAPGERATLTADRILTAAVEVLVERGLDGFTTPIVASRAGVAQGTVFRHFPSKQSLMVATVRRAIEAAVTECAEAFSDRLASSPPRDDDELIRLALEVLWTGYDDERIVAAYEIRARARTDADLNRALGPALGMLDVNGADLAILLLPESLRVPSADYRSIAQLVTNAMQGRALTRRSLPNPVADATLLDTLTQIVHDRVRAVAISPPPIR